MTKPSAPTSQPNRSRRRRPTGSGADVSSGRSQIIEAAIESILEVGFYRSSTNEIARRANVSWGAVQYHFGTREALMLAVVNELDRRFLADLELATVQGDTPEERVKSLYDILRRQYDTPRIFVRLQIVLNLQHDPDTSREVNAEIAEHGARAEETVRRLLREAVGPGSDSVSVEALFHALRGLALSRQLSGSLPAHGSRRQTEDATKLVLHVLASSDAIYGS